MHRPVCVPCGVNMACSQTGAAVHETDEKGRDMHIWQADIFACPKCGHEAIVGFGNAPTDVNIEPDVFAKHMEEVVVTFNGKHHMVPANYEKRS